MSFSVVFPQVLISNFPMGITCLDQIENKFFVGTQDGSILEYEIEEQPGNQGLPSDHEP